MKKKFHWSDLAFVLRSGVKLSCLCVWEAPEFMSMNIEIHAVRHTKHLFERLLELRCTCCSADAWTGVACRRLMDSLQAHVPPQTLNSTPVQSSLVGVQFSPVRCP